MITPNKVYEMALKKEYENNKFRRFLKNRADEDVLDTQFLKLHNELFKDYDCSECRNCCKMFRGEIPVQDIEKDAERLNLSVEEFIDKYLILSNYTYITKHTPCDFLLTNGECMLGDAKPESCVNYPHTNHPERIWSLLSFMENVRVCPVAYEICERLKREYHFR